MTKILIADDNAQNLYLLETILKSRGYEVISAKNGTEAIALALNNPPDMIVTDILMPEMDGFELCRRWKAHELLNHIPFVFYTATYTDLKDEKFGLSLGADRFVIKPQQPEVLLQIVGEVLAKPRKTRPVSRKKSPETETKVLEQYNEVLFRKLQKKVAQLEDVIAKQTKTENELRESEQKYRTLITQSPDGVFVVNLEGNFLAINKAMCENLKYSEDELLSMSIWDIVPEQYIELHKKRIADILVGKAPNTAAEYLVKGKDGNSHYVEILSAPYYEGEKLIGFQGIARDITERKKAEEQLKEYDERYKSLFEHSLNLLYLHDFEGNILDANDAALKTLGYSREELFSINFVSLLSEDQLPLALESSKEILERNIQTSVVEYKLRAKNGNTVNVETTGSLVYHGGIPYAIQGIARDITQRKQAEEALKKTLNDAINTMVKIVEMRDPYTAGHQQRVADLAIAIAGEMKLEDARIDQLRMAAVIHDIGKMYVPSDILSKPGRLSSGEISLIKTHAQGGYDIVKDMEFPYSVAQAILQHHERLDGSGYPNGLKGEDMLVEAKILSVADVVEAMSSHRPYRPALGLDKAFEEISNNSGKLYDPEVVDACLKLFKEQSFKFDK